MMINFPPRRRNDEIQSGGRRRDSYSKYLAPAEVRLGASRHKIHLFIYLSEATEFKHAD